MQGVGLSRFLPSGRGRSEEGGRSAPPVLEKLPLFGELLDAAATRGRCVVLDFAPASRTALALLNEIPCRLEILNLAEHLPRLLQITDAADFRRQLERLMPGSAAHPYSMVLCWDFLNYLPPVKLGLMMQRVAQNSAPGAQVHALMAYSSPQMAARPLRYLPADKNHIQVRPDSAAQRESPRYTPKDLLRAMPGYDIERAMVLRNGYQEYILRLTQ